MCVCVCVALVDLEAVGWMSQPRERGETPGLSLKVFLHLLNNSSVLSLFFFSLCHGTGGLAQLLTFMS